MLLKNWYKIVAGGALHPSSTGRVKVRDVTGAELSLYTTTYIPSLFPGISSNDVPTSLRQGTVFGTGDTPPTFDDYTLSGNQFTTFAVSSVDVTDTTYDANGISRSITYTLTNTGADVTIKEVARVWQTYKTSSSYMQVMLERTLLDEPITIPKGGVGQVTYTVRMEYPTA